jgi:hypothetical protein
VLQVLQVLVAATAVVIAAAGVSAEPRTIAGEVIDVRCYERAADNAGDAHVDCALSCARRGATLGIRTVDGVYTITGEYTAEMNRRLIEFVARTVEATGEVSERNGRRTIRIREIKLKTEG